MEKQILDQTSLGRILSRISIEILERNTDPSSLFIVGIKKRGDVLAEAIAEEIKKLTGQAVETAAVDITFYRDDVQLKAYKYVVKDEFQFDVTDKNVILVDDVIFTGRSIRAGIDVLIDSGRPRSIQLATLIDRGGREFPLQPDYVGKRVFAEPPNKVSVSLKEVDGEDKVIIS